MRELGQNEGKYIAGHARIYESKKGAGTLQEMKVSSCSPKLRLETALGRRKLYALSVGPERTERHEADYPLSHHHLHRPSDKMKLFKFLCLPKSHRRARSKARSEIGPIGDQGEAGLTVPRPTESAPDLRVTTSTLPTSTPLTLRDQEPNGM